jgi:hypothetical protein
LFEIGIPANVGTGRAGDLFLLKQVSEAAAGVADIIGNDAEVFDAESLYLVDSVFRNAAQTESTAHERNAIGQVEQGGLGVCENFGGRTHRSS